MRHRWFAVLFALSCSPWACSSSGSSANGGVNAANVSNVSDTFSALEGLLFDGSGNTKLSPRGMAGPSEPQPGDFSRMGCEYAAHVDELFQQVDFIRDPL